PGSLTLSLHDALPIYGVDVVFENIGDPDLFPGAFAALARGGRLITAGGHGGGTVPLDVKQLYLNQNTIIGSFGRIMPADVELGLDRKSTRLNSSHDQI